MPIYFSVVVARMNTKGKYKKHHPPIFIGSRKIGETCRLALCSSRLLRSIAFHVSHSLPAPHLYSHFMPGAPQTFPDALHSCDAFSFSRGFGALINLPKPLAFAQGINSYSRRFSICSTPVPHASTFRL